MAKQEYPARLGDVYAGESAATNNPDTVVIRAYVSDRKDLDRPVLVELTSKGARDVAARLLEEADKAEAAAKGRRA
ncbi:hypothetical protein [Streptomyces sp. MMBL 11-1]|uniref:hypothetical protein n=1 Tax=Streptomyces sp. MMBL 11-1 TaxID=3026420 RepID=UPI00235EC9CC|nr:hypothetical protein [Streptomyces sp. MMBL 11-1]